MVNSAATELTARKLRYIMSFLRHRKYSKLNPEKAYIPPNMPQAIKRDTHKTQVNLINRVCVINRILCYIFENKFVEVDAFGKVARDKPHGGKLCVIEYVGL